MKTRLFLLCILWIFGSIQGVFSQDLLHVLDKEQQDSLGYVSPPFKMTRISIGHSTEVRSAGILEVLVSNRFWNLPTERSQSFAADKMSTRFALEYAISDKLTAGIGGTTFDGLFDTFLKYRLMAEKKGINPNPVSITLFQGGSYNSNRIPYTPIQDEVKNRFSFTTQVLVSKRVTPNFSFQISPSYIYKGIQFIEEDPSHFFALGFGGRYKIGHHVSVVSEYYYNANPIESFDTYGPFSLGVNWELGDVLLQFYLTNAVNMVEDTFITQTRNNFNFRNPNLNFGFNATYVIHFKNSLKSKHKK